MAESRGESNSERGAGDQIQTIIGEFRVVIPAVAVLFGFQLTIAFAPGFDSTPPWLRFVNFVALLCTAASILFILAPTSYHHVTRGLDESYAYIHMAQRNAGASLAFLAASIALSVFVQAERSFGRPLVSGLTAGGLAALLVFAWWAMPIWRAHRRGTYGRRWLPHEDPDEAQNGSRARRRDRAS